MTCIRRPGATWSSCTCPDCLTLRARERKRYQVGYRHAPVRKAARARIDHWTERGYSAEWIASATGIPHRTVWSLVKGAELPHVANSRAILAADIDTATTGKRTALGATRRLQALAAAGWSGPDIREVSGLPLATISGYQAGRRSIVTAPTWRRVMAAWDALAGSMGRSVRTIKRAAAAGWSPPMAWDENIDDPAATPWTDSGPRGAHVSGYGVVNRDSLTDCAEWGMTVREAADRLGVSREAIEVGVTRHAPELRARFARNLAAKGVAA